MKELKAPKKKIQKIQNTQDPNPKRKKPNVAKKETPKIPNLKMEKEIFLPPTRDENMEKSQKYQKKPQNNHFKNPIIPGFTQE